MSLTSCSLRALSAVALFLTACTAPRAFEGWFEEAEGMHDSRTGFAAGAEVLAGFDEGRPGDGLEVGDRVLYGVRLLDEEFLVLLEVEGAVAGSFGSVLQSIQLDSVGGGDLANEGTRVQLEEPRNCGLVVTVFDGDGARIGRDRLVVAPALFCMGLAAGCASREAYVQELQQGRLGGAARRVLVALAACGEFLSLVRRSDCLRPLLEKAVAVNLWSVLRRFSVEVSAWCRILEAVPHGDDYRVPLTILVNDTPALDCSIVVTEPQSPGNVGAGIVSIVGIRPGERQPTVSLRLLAARLGRR